MTQLLRCHVVMTLLLLCSCLSSEIRAPAVNANPIDDKVCGDCHGSADSFAPPKDTLGHTATTFTGVGAHQAHLTDGTYRIALECNSCHLVPTAPSSVGHIDTDLPAEVLFGELAKIGGYEPAWNGTTCANVYCHGAALDGGALTEPNWTTVDGSQVFCGSCHGIPPPPPHQVVAANSCVNCHGDVVDADNNIIDKKLHINGEVNVSEDAQTCSSCHGSGSNNAPPQDTSGNTATTFAGVGAHQKHMTTAISTNVSCVECHVVPSQITDTGHTDTALPAEITFGTLAKTGNLNPVWNGTTCANTYCHGQFTGGLGFDPTWTTVNGTQGACGTCHARPPNTGKHRINDHDNLSCSACHGSFYSNTTVRVADHINGVKDVGGPGSQIQSWNKPSCNPTCHGSENW